MAAITSVVELVKPGEEIISINDLYGGTQNNFRDAFQWLSNSISKVSKSNPLITDQVRLPELPSGITIDSKLVHPLNASYPIDLTLDGISI